MSLASSPIDDLLAECHANGITLSAGHDGALTVDGPQHALTTSLLGRLRSVKSELLSKLSTASGLNVVGADQWRPIASSVTKMEKVCRCGSTTCRDVPIHDGQSVRRDCSRCGTFIEFPIWYGASTLQNEK